MAEWRVKVSGNESILDDLSRSSISSEWIIVKEADGEYYLKSFEFESMTEEEDIRHRSIEIINILNGIGKLIINNFEPIQLDYVTEYRDDGLWSSYVVSDATLNYSAPSGFITPLDPLITENCIKKAQRNEAIKKALESYGSQEHNFINLYKILGKVKDDVGGETELINKGWVNKAEIKRFKQAAQSEAAIGAEARHGSSKYNPPPKPMSLREARYLLQVILQKWIV